MVSLTKINRDFIFIRPEILNHPNIPKPLHGVSPRTVMGTDWWNKKRKEAYKKNNFCCYACGVHKRNALYHSWLEAHESYKIDYKNGVVRLIEIVALCHACHNYIHDGRLKKLIENKEITLKKYNEILNHGNKILNIKCKKIVVQNEVAEWGKWHLKLNFKKYYSNFKNFKEWRKFYHG